MASSSNSSRPLPGERPLRQSPKKKRTVQKDNWQRVVCKKRRASGQEYTSPNTRQVVPARRIGAPCDCPKACFVLLGEEAVQEIFTQYWGIGDHDAQTAYLSKMVTTKPTSNPQPGNSRRKSTYEWSVYSANRRTVVCKKAFLSIHNISDKRVRHMLSKMGETGVAPVDQRGRKTPPNKTPDEVLQLVDDHIRTLPTCSSHYSRAKSRNRVYLPPGYSQSRCYDYFKQWCAERDVAEHSIASFDAYRRRFSAFNIGARPPVVDTCSFCDRNENEMRVATVNNDVHLQERLKAGMRLHLVKADVAKNIMKAYQGDRVDDRFVIAMDLQQTLATPRLATNVAYYRRKMWTYNFGVHDIKENVAPALFVWNETVAKRGSCEIGSCLKMYIDTYVPANIKKLVIFSDNCGGQNKNLNLCLLLLRFVQSGRFTSIKHFFLMPGHSEMSCDRDFGNLEQYFYGRDIYTTDHYMQLMSETRRERPFNVVKMSSDQFLDLQPLQSKVTKSQVAKSKFKEGRMFKYTEEYKQGMYIWQSYSHEIEHPTEVKLQKGRRTTFDPTTFDLTSVDLPVKYPEGVQLRPEKLNDLNHLLPFVPLEYKPWFQDLFAAQGLLAAAGDDGEEDPDDPDLLEDDVLDY